MVIYFSGTGNARRVSLWLAGESRGEALPIGPEALERFDPEPGGLNGFVFPIHGFITVWPMLRFLWRLPRGCGGRVFVAAVTGGCRLGPVSIPGWEGSGLYLPLLILWAKGYRPVGARAFHFTVENWTALVPAPGEESCRGLMEQTRESAVAFARSLTSGRGSFSGQWSALAGAAMLPVSLGYLLAARFLLSKLFFASSRCNGCGLCAEHCPCHALEMRQGRPFWTFRCESCMRCMNFCPQRAVQASHLVVLAMVLLWGPLIRWCAGALNLFVPPGVAHFGAVFLSTALGIGFLAIFYRVWFWALRWKPVRLFFEYATLTRWYRRYREPATALRDFK